MSSMSIFLYHYIISLTSSLPRRICWRATACWNQISALPLMVTVDNVGRGSQRGRSYIRWRGTTSSRRAPSGRSWSWTKVKMNSHLDQIRRKQAGAKKTERDQDQMWTYRWIQSKVFSYIMLGICCCLHLLLKVLPCMFEVDTSVLDYFL